MTAGGFTFATDVSLSQYTNAGVTRTTIALSNLTIASLSSSSGSGSSQTVGLKNGQGTFVIISGTGATAAGVAGAFSGAITAGSANATASVLFNTTTNSETVVIGGQSTMIPAATDSSHPYVAISATVNVILGPLEIDGTFSEGSDQTPTGTLLVFLGQGPALAPDGNPSPAAKGLYLTLGSGATYSATKNGSTWTSFSATSSSANGISVSLAGFSGFSLSGTNLGVSWTGGSSASFSGDFSLTVNGVLTFTGTMGFSYAAGVLTVNFGNVSLGFGADSSGNALATVTSLTGNVTVSSAGIVVNLGGTLDLQSLPVTLDNTAVTLQLNTTGASASSIAPGTFAVIAGSSGSPVHLTVGGFQLQGVFGFSQVVGTLGPNAPAGSQPPKTIWIVASDVAATFGAASAGNGGVGITGASGTLVISGGTVAASITVPVLPTFTGLPTTGSGAATFSGTFTLKLNTSGAAIDQQATIGSASYDINVPAGPYFMLEGDNVTLTIANQTVSGTFVFTSATNGGAHVVQIAISNLTAALGNGTQNYVTLSNGNGALELSGSGLAGTLGGTVAVTIPGASNVVSLSGTLQLVVNTGGAAVHDTIIAGSTSSGVAAALLADVNGDGKPDLLVGLSSGQVDLYLNQGGSAPFAGTAITIDGGSSPVTALALADVNGDSAADLLVGTAGNAIAVYLGDNKGDFTAGTPISTTSGSGVTALATGDLNGDGGTDLVTIENGTVYTYLNGGFDTTTNAWNGISAGVALPSSPSTADALAVGDVNADGAPDIVAGTPTAIDLFLNGLTAAGKANGTFATPTQLSGGATALALGDVNGDGYLDLIVTTSTGSHAYLSTVVSTTVSTDSPLTSGTSGSVSLTSVTGLPASGTVNVGGAVLQYSAVSGSAITVGTPPTTIDLGPGTTVTAWTGFGSAMALTGTGSSAIGGSTVTVADLNGDGHLDVIISSATSSTVLLGNGSGGFTAQSAAAYPLPTAFGTTALLVGDISGDGTADVVDLSSVASKGINLLLGISGGLSAPAVVGETKIDAPAGPYLDLQGTGLTVTLGGESFTGAAVEIKVAVTGGTRTVTLSLHEATFTFGGDTFYVQGDLQIAAGGVAGSLSISTTAPASPTTTLTSDGSVTIGGATITGTLTVAVNTGSTAVVVGSTALPAGPFAEISAIGASITLGSGPSLSGSFVVESLQDSNGQQKYLIGASGVTVSLGSGLSSVLKDASGLLVIESAGVAGQLQGTVDLSGLGLPSTVNLTGTFGLVVNQTNARVTESVMIGGQTESIDVGPGPYVEISATDAQLTVFGQTLSGTVAVTDTNSTIQLVASNLALSLTVAGTPLLAVTNGNGTLTVSSGGVVGTLTATVNSQLSALSLSGTFSLAINTTNSASGTPQIAAGTFSFSAAPLTISILGQSLTANVKLTRDADGTIDLTITGLNVTLGSAAASVTITQPSASGDANGATVSATLHIAKAGVSGDISADFALGIGNGILSATGAAHIVFSPGSLFVQLGSLNSDGTVATPVVLTVDGSQTLSGVFTVSATKDAGPDGVLHTSDDQTILQLSAVGVTASIGGATVYARLTNGNGLLLITPAGVAAQISGTVVLHLSSTINASATGSLAINTLTTAVKETFALGAASQTLTLPAGPYVSAALTDVTLTLGGLQVTGDFSYTNDQGAITIAVANAGFKLGDGSRDYVVVSGAGGTLHTSTSGAGVYGTVTNANVVVSVPGAGISGTFSATFNTTATNLDATGAAVPTGSMTTVAYAQGIEVSGTGVTLSLLGQTLSGNLDFVDDTTDHVIAIGVTDMVLTLGPAGSPIITATANGFLVIGPAGIAGSLTAALTTSFDSNVISFTGLSATLTINETGQLVTRTFNGLGSSPTTVSLVAGRYVRVDLGADPTTTGGAASPISVTLLGQTISGHFWFEQLVVPGTTSGGITTPSSTVIALGVDYGYLSLGTSTDYVHVGSADPTVNALQGFLLITSQGIAGSLTATVAVSMAGITASGTASVELNNSATQISESFTTDPAYQGSGAAPAPTTTTFTVPAGPFIAVSVTGAQITLGGASISTGTDSGSAGSISPTTLYGNLSFQTGTVVTNGTATKVTEIGVTDLTTNPDPAQSDFTVSGALVFDSAHSGLAGVLMGTIGLNNVPGISANATAKLEVNTTGAPVNETVCVGGVVSNNSCVPFATGGATPQAITINMPDATDKWQLIAQVSLNFDNLIEVDGTFAFTSGGFVASDVLVFVGSGCYQTCVAPAQPGSAIGLLIQHAQVSYLDESSHGTGQYVLYATGAVSLVGLDGLTISGIVTVEINTTGTPTNLTDPAKSQTQVDCTTTPADCLAVPISANTFSVQATGVTIAAGGVLSINGNLSATRTANGTLYIAITPVLQNNQPQPVLTIMDGTTTLFSITGSTVFSIDPVSGFHLTSLSINDFSLLGLDAGLSNTPTYLAPTATVDSVSQVDGSGHTTIDVSFVDPNGGTIDTTNDATGVLSNLEKFTVLINGVAQPNAIVSATPTAVPNHPGQYAFTVSGLTANASGTMTIQFLAGSFANSEHVTNIASSQSLVLPTTSVTASGLLATISSPTPGQAQTAAELNAAAYIDVTYSMSDGSVIPSAIISQLNTITPFTLAGTAIGAQLQFVTGSTPTLIGTPTALNASSTGGDKSITYRYYLSGTPPAAAPTTPTVASGSPSTSSTPTLPVLFQAGTLTIAFVNGPFATGGTGVQHIAQTVTVSASAPGSATSSNPLKIGPLSLQGPTISLENFGFKNGMLDVTIVVGATNATLAFGGSGSTSQSGSGVTASLTGILGKLEVQVDVLGLLKGNVRVNVPGNFSLSVAQLTVSIPQVATLTASGVQIAYDPNGGPTQKVLVIQDATLAMPKLNVTLQLTPYDVTTHSNLLWGGTAANSNDTLIPGLVVTPSSLTIGQATLTYTGTISVGSLLTITNPSFSVADLMINFSGSQAAFQGSISVAAGAATFLQNEPVSATLSSSGTEHNADGSIDHNAIELTFVFSGGTVSGFTAHVDTMTITLGKFLILTTSNFNLDLDAAPNAPLISFASIGASVTIGSLQITGQAQNFAFDGDGTFVPGLGPGHAFGVTLSIGSATGSSFAWPSFLPIQIQSIGISWPNGIATDPGDFVLTLSATVTGIQGLGGLTFSGSVQGIQIDPSLLLAGENPILGITSLGVSVSGPAFGGQLDASLVGGIERLDGSYNIIDPTDTTTPVAHRVFYLGIQGGFSIAGLAGLTIQLGLSELGPLDVQLSVSLPEGIVLDPDTGIAINNFYAGVEFYKTLPAETDPLALESAQFNLPTQVPPAQWLASLQQQVAAQAKAQNGTANFLAAFENPMLIIGSATIFDIYTSQQLFNGTVTVMISTDGKFLISGTLNFADNQLSIVGKLYADLSQVSSGKVTVLFLGQVPQQFKLLTAYGKLQMGFENAEGDPVTFDVVAPAVSSTAASTTPTATLSDPSADGGVVDVNVANSQPVDTTGTYITDPTSGQTISTGTEYSYVDVSYAPATGANLNYGSIYNSLTNIVVTEGAVSYSIVNKNAQVIPVVTVPGSGTYGTLYVPLYLDTTTSALDPVVYTFGPARSTLYLESELSCYSSSNTTNPFAACTDPTTQMFTNALAAASNQDGTLASHLDMVIGTATVNGISQLVITDLAYVAVLDWTTYNGAAATSNSDRGPGRDAVRDRDEHGERPRVPLRARLVGGVQRVHAGHGQRRDQGRHRGERPGHRRLEPDDGGPERRHQLQLHGAGTDGDARQPGRWVNDRHQRRQRAQLDRHHLHRAGLLGDRRRLRLPDAQHHDAPARLRHRRQLPADRHRLDHGSRPRVHARRNRPGHART